jgi:hypothetical protein
MAHIDVATGTVTLTSEGDFEGCTFTPTNGEDTTTSPGDLLLAAGITYLTVLTPIYHFDPWSLWIRLILSAVTPAKTAVSMRFRVATTEGGIAAAPWSIYDDATTNADGYLEWILLSYCLNNPSFAIGPFAQMELVMAR